MALLSIDTGSESNRFLIRADAHVAGDPVGIWAIQSGVGVGEHSTAGFVPDEWQHVCAVFAATNDRRIYLNGGSEGLGTDNRAPAGTPNNFRIGSTLGSDPAPFDGLIAEAALWRRSFTKDQAIYLAAGGSPSVFSLNLISRWPLVDDSDDAVGSVDLTANGTVLDADHPTIYGSGGDPIYPVEAYD